MTGLPGARKWTGGVFGRYMFTVDGFPDSVDRWTMEVNKQHNGIVNTLTSHDYLGYSVRYGCFGFSYETSDRKNFTIVSGATRFGQTGAVVFLPFYGTSRPGEEKMLGLQESRFILEGNQLGSGFGYEIEVLDLDNNGFDDLIVGAPFEFHFEEDLEFGGAVYIYYSKGIKMELGKENQVFHDPIVLRGRGLHSQFGISLANLGDIDKDANGFKDFAVGAPYADSDHGAVYIYHGNVVDDFSTEPVQTILGSEIKAWRGNKKLRTFGASLNGQVDIDRNGYNDLAVGAYASDSTFLFKSRPVVDVKLGYNFPGGFIKINEGYGCPRGSKTCFDVITSLTLLKNDKVDFGSETFTCELKVIQVKNGKNGKNRAVFTQTNSNSITWPCQGSAGRELQRRHQLHIPIANQDWVNPIQFNFTVKAADVTKRDISAVVRGGEAFELFENAFDKKCGEDNDCYTDLAIRPVLLNMT